MHWKRSELNTQSPVEIRGGSSAIARSLECNAASRSFFSLDISKASAGGLGEVATIAKSERFLLMVEKQIEAKIERKVLAEK